MENHTRNSEAFIVALLKKINLPSLGKSREQAVRCFLFLERSLRRKGRFEDVDTVVREYYQMGHAEMVPSQDLDKDTASTFYLPIHKEAMVSRLLSDPQQVP